MIPGIVSVQATLGGGGLLQPALVTEFDSFPSASIGRATSFGPPGVNVTLSNGNTTVTHSNSSTNSGAFSPDNKPGGQYYFEVTMTTIHGDFDCCGISSSVDIQTLVTENLSCTKINKKLGNIFSNNNTPAVEASMGDLVSGDVINIAIDMTARKAWFRKNGTGNWNASGTANPATGAGGIAIQSSGPFRPAVGFGGTGTASGDAMTAKFMVFTYTPPSGFGIWPGA